MAEDFLTTDTLPGAKTPAAAAPEKKTRKRGPMSEAQKEKIRASNKARVERLKAEKAEPEPKDEHFLKGQIPTGPVWTPAVDVKTGLGRDEAEELKRELAIAEAEKRMKEAAIPVDSRLMVHQEIKVDSFNTLRRYVELTPSMCRAHRNCPWDAAKEVGATDWNNAPVDQVMSDGRTFGERLIAMREYHEATAHTITPLNDHIVRADELEKRQWGIGQNIRGEFLQGAK